MLKQVSWADYFSVIAVLLAIYYFIIILFFYKEEIRILFRGKVKLFAGREVPAAGSDN